ncbi:MAG: type I polyketide synthase [Tolypothrix brevis GSE-NOS-MK-07-07A]|jgi:acyl transferase domain-containing protein/acyl carrier protein|nr:type I polyketide synthase [Tolypothrix brevis GSE-NOS-MK-07-07A]
MKQDLTSKDYSSLMQNALIKLEEMQTHLSVLERARTEPIAIIGIGCRFPGGANNPNSFWKLLRDGLDAVTEVPRERWDIDAYYDADQANPGKMYTRYGSFLEQVDKFDSQFFGIPPREAALIDPQQRLLLEVSWEALEHAGLPPERQLGSKTGVFVGVMNQDYLQLASSSPKAIDIYTGTGNAVSFAAGRLSYLLGLQGPSLVVDTACSSSLLAVHLACQSLRTKESHLALAGGVNLILSPISTIIECRAQMLTPDNHCKTFDAAADGFVRGEGCGVVVLKRLSDACRDRDNILALIRGSAVNQDGRSSGLTVPKGKAQEELICQALSNANVEPDRVSYIEAHGTGTSLGDPIEVKALGTVFGKNRPQDEPLVIGSVKTNIGHLEGAAGIAGLIKVVLAMQHGEIPPHLHFQQPNPYIDWEKLPVIVPTKLRPWFLKEGRRIAGVSSFGFSGTNAHVVLEEAPLSQAVPVDNKRPWHLLTLSAKTPEALQDLAIQYENYVTSHPDLLLGDICYSASTGRSHFSHRLCLLTESLAQTTEQLAAFTRGQKPTGVLTGDNNARPKIAFLFTGQGSQYVKMGQQLYQTQPTFRAILEQCDEILRPHLEKPLLSVLYPQLGDSCPLDDTAYTQPALFALEYALFQLWKSWGITPDAVMGHSVGEYVAACVAGVFSLEDGLKLIAQRGRLMQEMPGDGEMVAVFADAELVRDAIQSYSAQVAIAAINGPENVVISGHPRAVAAIVAALEAEKVLTKKLSVSHAFHSPLMAPILADFARAAQQVTYSCPRIEMISNLTGTPVNAEIATAEYWVKHLRQPVQFADSIKTLHQQGYEVFVECGPKPTLLAMGRKCLASNVGVWLPSLHPGQEDWQQMLLSLAQLYVRGVSVDWFAFEKGFSHHKVNLPTYPWQKKRYWISTNAENEQQKSLSLLQGNNFTPIIDFLNQGNTKQLAEQLEKAGELLENEIKVLPKLLDLLVKQHQKQLTAATFKNLLYKIDWQLKPRQSKTVLKVINNSEAGNWLIFADSGDVGQALAKQLQEEGQSCILIYAGNSYQSKETGIFSLNPSIPENFERLFQEVLLKSQLPLKGIIHLWSLDTAPSNDLTLSDLEQAQKWGCGSVLHLIQELVKHYNKQILPKLWLVTRGVQQLKAHTASLAVAQAPLWGLGKVIAVEHPQLWGGAIDLALEATEDEVSMLMAEIGDSIGEDHLAFRKGNRFVARLVHEDSVPSQEVVFQADGTYLITGGLGALGLKVAAWMVDLGVRYLVLTGRRGVFSPEIKAAITRMEHAGTKILVAKADVSSQQDMTGVFEKINSSMPPLRGIVHAAGVSKNQTIEEIDLNSFESVLRPKVVGTWILHQLTQGLDLDFFLNFSSIASVWGSKGQAHYAAANHFLDVFANYRQGLKMKTLSVNWGLWAGDGMATPEEQNFLTRMGLKVLQPEQAVTILGYLLGSCCNQTTVADVDWTLFKKFYEARGQRSLLEQIVVQPPKAGKQQSGQHSEIFKRLEAAKKSDRTNILIVYIQQEVSQALGLEPSQVPDPQQGFFDMGIDSLIVHELIKRLEASLDCSLPSTLIFEFPNITKLSKYLSEEVLGWESSKTVDAKLSKREDERLEALSEIEQLAEDELEVSIAQRLAKLETLVNGN